MEYRITSRAYRDIEQIVRYIEIDSALAAADVLQRIQHTLAVIALMPKIGRVGVRPGTREVPMRGIPFLIVYRLRAETVEVISVFHTAQDPTKK